MSSIVFEKMIYDDYIAYSDEYRRKYGTRTVVLMEVGSFFEIYAVQNKDESSGADIGTICDLCNLQLSRKNKTIVENNRQNPLMAGFPSYALNKHTEVLLANNFTVVLIRQVTQPPNPRREVTEVLSPGLQLAPQGVDGSWLFVSYWNAGPCSRTHSPTATERTLNAGFCGIDVSTGQTWMYEAGQTTEALNEMTKCISVYQPREVIFIGSPSLTPAEQATITETAGVLIDSSRNFHVLWDATKDTKYMQIKYQNSVLEKAYGGFEMLSAVEALDMEHFDNVRTAFTYMLQFAYEHNNAIIQHLKKPTHLSFDKRCNLEHTSAVQLQLISSGVGKNERPMVSVLARCATAFGTRAFKARLLMPTYDKDELESRYQQIEHCIRNVDVAGTDRELRGVLDIERLARRILLGSYSPTDWPGFQMSLGRIISAAQIMQQVDIIDLAQRLQSGFKGVLNLTECAKYLISDIKGNIFFRGVYADVDATDDLLKTAWASLQALTDFFNTYIPGACKIEFNERDGYTIQVTKKRWETIRAALPGTFAAGPDGPWAPSEFESRPVSTSSSVVRVSHPRAQLYSDEILKLTKRLGDVATAKYKDFLTQYGAEFKPLLYDCVKLVSDMDVVVTCARNAMEYKYRRPRFVEAGGGGDGGGVNARALRHPILERIHTKTVYTPNDVCLGRGAGGASGMLLFGVNSSGKSSLMKAIGLNIIMAQAGMYVAAEDFEYEPYRAVFTRIMGMDDIYRGWSTFTVEMMELRNILLRGDAHSLVLGDELCSGTESLSGTAIVAAGIETLSKNHVSFVFATHLHDLAKMVRVHRADVKLWHMHVEWQGDTIVFDRRLRKGVGSGVYGLEVCQGLNLPSTFIKLAHEVRCELEGRDTKLVADKPSRYNAGVFMDMCQICGAPPSETHHISPQAAADDDGFIDHFHKNSTFNLLTVCGRCHDEIHAGKRARPRGFVATTQGIRLHLEAEAEAEAVAVIEKAKKYIRVFGGQLQTRKTVRSAWGPADEAVLTRYGVDRAKPPESLHSGFLAP